MGHNGKNRGIKLKVQGRFLLTFHVTSEEIRYKINDYRSFYIFLRLSWEISFQSILEFLEMLCLSGNLRTYEIFKKQARIMQRPLCYREGDVSISVRRRRKLQLSGWAVAFAVPRFTFHGLD